MQTSSLKRCCVCLCVPPRRPLQCNLHIHGEHSRNNRIVPMVALSEATAVGVVIAHGICRAQRRLLTLAATTCE